MENKYIPYSKGNPDFVNQELASIRKWMDSGRLNKLGWHSQVTLNSGLRLAYSDMLKQLDLG